MNRKISILVMLILVLFFSISAIQASEVNVTGDNSLNSSNISLQLEDNAQFNELELVNSNYLLNGSATTFKNQTELVPLKTEIYGCFNVVLRGTDSNTTLANKSVNFMINGVKYFSTTDYDGIACVNLTKPGNYVIDASFAGDDSYDNCNLTSAVEVFPTIKASDISKYYKGTTYTATFFDYQGNALANTIVEIRVNGKSYYKKTNNNGLISLK